MARLAGRRPIGTLLSRKKMELYVMRERHPAARSSYGKQPPRRCRFRSVREFRIIERRKTTRHTRQRCDSTLSSDHGLILRSSASVRSFRLVSLRFSSRLRGGIATTIRADWTTRARSPPPEKLVAIVYPPLPSSSVSATSAPSECALFRDRRRCQCGTSFVAKRSARDARFPETSILVRMNML